MQKVVVSGASVEMDLVPLAVTSLLCLILSNFLPTFQGVTRVMGRS
jgi:hypothetical protein